MVGGGNTAVDTCRPMFDALAPGVNAAPRTQPDSNFTWYPEEYGWMHCGPAGAGHCLLYTSPSPRDLSTSRMPSSA